VQRKNSSFHLARIRVVGIGSGGRTAIDGLIASGIKGVDLLVIDTDTNTLRQSRAPLLIHIGKSANVRKGTGGNARQGREIAQKAIDVIDNALHGSDLVFIVAGLGGGTGTGVAPIVAEVANHNKALIIGIVTAPFTFEGEKRIATAREGIAMLKKVTDTLIVVPNDRLLELGGGAIGFHETYRLANDIWCQSIHGISELLNQSGLINVDFADLRTIISKGGGAIISSGRGYGNDRAREAAEQALHSKLLGIAVDGAYGVLFNITGGPDMTLLEVEEAAAIITGRVHADANVIFGATIDENLGNEMRVTVIATGFGFSAPVRHRRLQSTRTPWQPETASAHQITS
jgi:cell division protein FtsZ